MENKINISSLINVTTTGAISLGIVVTTAISAVLALPAYYLLKGIRDPPYSYEKIRAHYEIY